MKKLIKFLSLVIIISLVMSVSLINESSAENLPQKFKINGKNYIRTFYDEFEGTQLNDNNWEYCPEYYRQGDYCKWSKSMANLDGNGHLELGCNYNDDGDLLTGAVRTRSRFYQRYGYFEIRAKLQSKEGFWSAFWLMPDRIDSGVIGGIDGTEIDIFEAPKVKKKEINYAIHYDGYGANHTSVGKTINKDVYDGQFHNFALEWDKDNYIFYIDGEETYRITSNNFDSRGNRVSISRVESYMKISLESSLGWTGKPNPADMPDKIVVDYVKAYQRADYYATDNVISGDLDLDLDITGSDSNILTNFLANNITKINKANADVNRDGKVNVKDSLIIKKYLAGIITELPYIE